MSKTYHSIYAPYIEELIAVKRNMGFKYTYVESVFSDFDQFILQNYNEAIGITKVISEQWCKRRENESFRRILFFLSGLTTMPLWLQETRRNAPYLRLTSSPSLPTRYWWWN